MDKVQKIRAEVERQIPLHICGYQNALKDVLKFIDSLSKETVSEDLEEAASECYYRNHAYARESFIEGANWMKEHLLKDSEPAEISYWNQRGLSIRLDKYLEDLGFGEDTKVKVIIIKEEEK